VHQHTAGECVAEALVGALDARELHDVRSDTEDHDVPKMASGTCPPTRCPTPFFVSEPPGDDVLAHFAALQRALAEMALQDAAEQPPRGLEAVLVVERLASEREQLPPPVRMLVLDPVVGRSRSLLRVVQIAALRAQRLAGL